MGVPFMRELGYRLCVDNSPDFGIPLEMLDSYGGTVYAWITDSIHWFLWIVFFGGVSP
jgi:hypothetical protein